GGGQPAPSGRLARPRTPQARARPGRGAGGVRPVHLSGREEQGVRHHFLSDPVVQFTLLYLALLVLASLWPGKASGGGEEGPSPAGREAGRPLGRLAGGKKVGAGFPAHEVAAACAAEYAARFTQALRRIRMQ